MKLVDSPLTSSSSPLMTCLPWPVSLDSAGLHMSLDLGYIDAESGTHGLKIKDRKKSTVTVPFVALTQYFLSWWTPARRPSQPCFFCAKAETLTQLDGGLLAHLPRASVPGLSRSRLESTRNGPVSGGIAALASRPLASNRVATVFGMGDLPFSLVRTLSSMWSCRGAAQDGVQHQVSQSGVESGRKRGPAGLCRMRKRPSLLPGKVTWPA